MKEISDLFKIEVEGKRGEGGGKEEEEVWLSLFVDDLYALAWYSFSLF